MLQVVTSIRLELFKSITVHIVDKVWMRSAICLSSLRSSLYPISFPFRFLSISFLFILWPSLEVWKSALRSHVEFEMKPLRPTYWV